MDTALLIRRVLLSTRLGGETRRELKFSNPLNEYEGDFIDGAIIDIGCGQSPFLLDYANSNKTLYAVDSEQSQLDFLSKRAHEISVSNLQNWRFVNANFPEDPLPEDRFSLIILSNLLHFFTLEECKKLVPVIDKISQKGTLIYIRVHSYLHYTNDPSDPENHSYFKHYFEIDDFNYLFPEPKFEQMYVAHVDKKSSNVENQIIEKWLEKALEKEGITSKSERQKIKNDYIEDNKMSDIQIIFRKR